MITQEKDKDKVRVLLVDDEPDVCEFIGYNLTKHGFSVNTCSNGKQALIKAMQFHPHIIIMDVMMPEMDGIQTCRVMRENSEFKNTIIAFFSAWNESLASIQGFSAGGDDYIYKPSDPAVVVARINALVEKFFPTRFPSFAA
jgi:two-component system alkaline phosphatase synthesis response regulator PhoP